MRVSWTVVFIEPKGLLLIVFFSVVIVIRMHVIGAPMEDSILVIYILILLRLCVEVGLSSADVPSVILGTILVSSTGWRIVKSSIVLWMIHFGIIRVILRSF